MLVIRTIYWFGGSNHFIYAPVGNTSMERHYYATAGIMMAVSAMGLIPEALKTGGFPELSIVVSFGVLTLMKNLTYFISTCSIPTAISNSI